MRGTAMTQRLLVFAATALLALPAAGQEVVIKAAKIYTQTGAPLVPGMVRIKDGKIAEVARDVAAPSGAKVIDLGQGVLVPGFIDAYTSIGIDGGTSEQTREVTPNFRALDAVDWWAKAFRHALAEGTTTVGLDPGTDNVIAGLASVVKTAGKPADRVVRPDYALAITAASDPASGNGARSRPDSIYNRQPTNRMGVVWILRSEFQRAGQGTAAESAVVREALSGKKPVVCVSRSESDIYAALRLKQDYKLAMTIAGGAEAYKLGDALAAAKTPVLLSKLTTTTGVGPEQTEVSFNTAGLLHGAGVSFALTGGQLLEQAQFAVRRGLPAEAALAAITSTPAKLLGVDGRVGAIAVGRDADLVALTGDPFELTTAVRWTMCGGAIHEE